MGKFDGKSVVVTGAASGVGKETVLGFVAEGAKVFGIDINSDGLDALAAEVGDAVTTGVFDITSRSACQDAAAAAVAANGGIDVLANVAGVAMGHHLTDVTEDQWDLIMGVNVNGMFWLTQACIPHLQTSGGNVVNVSSNAGLMGQAYTVPYCASKGAVINMTRAMAMEYIKTEMRFNVVCPGGMVTGLTNNYQMPADVDFEIMGNYMGLRGMAGPDSAANAIVWLASSEAERCNGTILSVDGGLTAA